MQVSLVFALPPLFVLLLHGDIYIYIHSIHILNLHIVFIVFFVCVYIFVCVYVRACVFIFLISLISPLFFCLGQSRRDQLIAEKLFSALADAYNAYKIQFDM